MRPVQNTKVAIPMSTHTPTSHISHCPPLKYTALPRLPHQPSHSTLFFDLKRKPHPTNKFKINLIFYYGDWQLKTSKFLSVPQDISPENQQE